MSATRRPRPVAARRRKAKKPAVPAWQGPESTLSRADRALIERLLRKGIISNIGPDFGKPLDPNDEILKPGPPCPGAVEALIADRRSGL